MVSGLASGSYLSLSPARAVQALLLFHLRHFSNGESVMLDFKKVLCGALAVVMATSSAFAVGKLSQDGSYAPAYADGKYSFVDPVSKIPITWKPQSTQATQQSIEELMRQLTAAQTATGPQGSKLKAAAVHTIKAFPAESLYFFIGMGAVAFSQLVFDNSQNPVGLEQHITHSLSPMGMAGFAVFMYANNLTSSTLQTMIKNKSFMKYIPYLGMTAGFGMQSIFSHVMSDPNIKFCAFKKKVTDKDLEEGVDANPCKKAIENFSDLRLAPSLTSMLLSTMMAGKAQEGIKALAGKAEKPLLRLTGFDLAFMLAPGKIQLTGIRAVLVNGLGKVAQITAFVAIDAWLNRIVTYGWKNAFDGKDFWNIDNRIASRVKDLKANNWNELTLKKEDQGILPAPIEKWLSEDRPLEEQLTYFQKRMTDWRMTNLADVYEAHQNWNASLGQLIGNYKGSYEFYQTIIDRIRISRYNLSPVKPLEILYPLTGVKPYNVAPEAYDGAVTHVKTFETYQRENVAVVAKMLAPQILVKEFPKFADINDADLQELSKKAVAPKLESALSFSLTEQEVEARDQENFVKIQKLFTGLDAKDRKKIETFRQMILSKDDTVLAKALYNLRKEQNPALRDPEKPFSKMILALIEILGAPSPQMEPGRGYLLGYQYAPSKQQYMSGIDFRHGSSIFGTQLITDYYMMQMVCGPDVRAGEKLVDDNLGYPSKFKPPMIRPAKHEFKEACQSGYAFMEPDKIYSYKFEQDGKKYRGFLNYVRDNVGASIIGQKDGSSNFKNWWTALTTPQVKEAFDVYAERYDEIVVKMMRALYYQRKAGVEDFIYETLSLNQNGKNTLNRGPVFNGTISAITQEEHLYLAVLEQMITPERAYDFHIDLALNYKVKVPALQEIDNEIAKLVNLLTKIRIVEKDGRERIQSSLANSELTSQVEAVEAAITTVRQAMGVDTPGIGIEGSPLAFTETQKKVAKVALDSLSKIAAEIANYGNIAHAVSWDKIHDEGSGETTQTKTGDNVKKALKNSGAATNPAGR
jgi:hypothetical protein